MRSIYIFLWWAHSHSCYTCVIQVWVQVLVLCVHVCLGMLLTETLTPMLDVRCKMPYISLDTSQTFLCVSLLIQTLPCCSWGVLFLCLLFFLLFLLWPSFSFEASCVVQAGLKFLGSSNPPASAPQIAGTIGACHCTESVHHSIA